MGNGPGQTTPIDVSRKSAHRLCSHGLRCQFLGFIVSFDHGAGADHPVGLIVCVNLYVTQHIKDICPGNGRDRAQELQQIQQAGLLVHTETFAECGW